MKPSRIYFVAAEPSGDLLAREVIECIRDKSPAAEIAAIGGAEISAIGLVSPIDVAPLSVLGFAEGVRAYRDVVRLADAATEAILAFRPDAVVLVDSWGFMLRVAQRIRKRDPSIRLIKLIGPQVWATRPGRAKTLAAAVDYLLCMHEMEVPYYEQFGLPVTVVGNPALSRAMIGDGAAFRASRNIDDAEQLVLVLPGSRKSEIEKVAPALVEAARQVKNAMPDTRIVIAPAGNIASQFAAKFLGVDTWADVVLDTGQRYDAMAAATLAIACSGTVTSEVAMQGTPMIVGYRTGWITWALARGLLYRKQHITLLNIVSDDQEIVPEFVQARLTPENLSSKALELLGDADLLKFQKGAQGNALARMQQGGEATCEIASRVILDVAAGSAAQEA